ncbi:hypothetical protein M404DRAFT_28840 [Pisolithus tinctorius Marx 270]|uniref:protein-serine/threonine phosphatase n=1 Tax=Pisolithus tinctorius Marx 270 TaxID=870435 RepID=A0A0C3P1D2_PISTI|nr:hypothetical protein M404DRAFT_28840 [Pisolithus tinctorius Marx 270]
MTAYGPNKWIAQLMKCQHLPEQDMKILCDAVRAILLEESNIQPVSTPVTLCGDIHAQFWDLLELLREGSSLRQLVSHFVGGSVDWGPLQSGNRVIVLSTQSKASVPIIAWPIVHGHPVILTRSRCEEIMEVDKSSESIGFMTNANKNTEAPQRGKLAVTCSTISTSLHPSQIIDGETLYVHGALSEYTHSRPNSPSLKLESFDVTPTDLTWSDPDDINDRAVSPRGADRLFGGNVTQEFNHVNSLSLIAHAHQLVQEGYKYMFANAPSHHMVRT